MSFTSAVASLGWRLTRYRLVGDQLPHQPGIVLGAPHTSNWDFVAFLGVMWSQNLKMRVLVKNSMFKGPLGPIIKAFGGIPVDRENPAGVVDELIERAKRGESFQLVIAPKGTRKPRPYWKSGFYRIALATGLPVSLASIDSVRREVEIGPTIEVTGDVAADMDLIRAFYADKAGVHPQNRSEPRLREEDAATRRF